MVMNNMPCPSVPKNPTPSSNCNKGCVHYFEPLGLINSINTNKVRPYIIISRTNDNSSRVIIAPITDIRNYIEKGKMKYPYHVPLLKRDYLFLDKDSCILLDQVYTVGKDELWQEWYIGKMEDTLELDKAISYNFDLYESIAKEFSRLISDFEDIYKKNFSRK